MPAIPLKQLHLATSVDKLKYDIDAKAFQKKSAESMVISAFKLFKSGEEAFMERDEEKAYIQFMKFCEFMMILQKKVEFQKHREYKCLFKNTTEAIGKIEQLRSSLERRYKELNAEKILQENEKNDKLSALQNGKVEVIVPEPILTAPVQSPPKLEEVVEHSISSSKLFSLLNENPTNIIIMDTRPAKDFNESHIKYTHCVSIPQEVLKPGITALRLESMLPPDSLGNWFKREKADNVVLVDWDSMDETLQSPQLDILKQAMSKWDQKCSLKKPPMILQGGYKDWMLKYPMYTTKAINFNYMGDTNPVSIITDVSVLDYPDLDEPELNTSKNSLNGPGMLFKKSNVNSHIPNNNTTTSNSVPKSAPPTVDRKTKPSDVRTIKSSDGDRRLNNNHKNTTMEDKSIPTIIKNFTPKSNADKELQLVNSLNKESSLAKENLELVARQLAKEEEFEMLRLRKGLEAEESMRAEIQKREEQLSASVKQLEIERSEKDKECLKMKEDNKNLRKLLQEKTDEEMLRKEKEILETERKKKEMQLNVDRLREQRKKEELAKKLPKADVTRREVVSANTGLKRNTSSQDQTSYKVSEYKIPLAREDSTDGSSRGLIRSHSSPNIAQMVNEEDSPQRKTPSIDRTLKPKAPTPNHYNEINRARLRNLNPVYGNCPIRPATGLRNLGNTCFMNSIIQCLSNTIPLAEYFTSGQYMEDINRDSKHGEVAEEFAVVLKSLWMGQYKSFSPKDFKNTVSKCFAVCIGNEQQDSHEFLVVLMEKLHADLNKKCIRPVPKLESCNDEPKFWMHHKNYNTSKISGMYEGLLKSTLTCMSCRTTSDNFEVFSCLSLPIMSSRCSLEECFQHFLKPEKICGEAAWDCPKCKQKKEAEKRLRICRLPQILVIQLKRFSYEGLWRRKLQTTVDFDYNLDVRFEKNNEPRFRKYTLYGTVNHFGTLEGGHYTAYCSTSSRRWFKYDDHEVSEISSSDIRTSAAYILFYQATDLHSSL